MSSTLKEHWEDLSTDKENSTKMDLEEIKWEGMDWINLAQDRNKWYPFVNEVINY
jgi:hypothetical protein